VKTKKITTVLAVTLLLPVGEAAGEPDEGDDRFALCGPARELPPAPQATKGYKLGTTEFSADEAALEKEGISSLTGHVAITRGDKAARADRVTYNKKRESVHAHGHVRFWDPKIFWWGEHSRINLDKDEANFEKGKYRLAGEQHGHGEANLIKHNSRENVTWLQNVDYTTCEGLHPDWELEANRMRLDHEAEWGEATHAFFNVMDVPVMYVPYFTFPLSDKRKTGLLPPSIGTGSKRGFDLTIPFYWNIAPEYDATLSPRIMAKRGLMLGGQGRYLFPTGHGQLDFNYMPDDWLRDEDRHTLTFKHLQTFAQEHGRLSLNYNEVSDSEYFEDFGRNLTTTSTRFVPQQAVISYGDQLFGLSWNIRGNVQKYDIVDKSLGNSPYERLPQVLFQIRTPYENLTPNFEFMGEAVYFDREDDIVGTRVNLKPAVSLPIFGPSAFLTPRLSLIHTQYYLDESNANNNVADRTPNDPSRTLPVFSVDSGLFFERDFDLWNSAYTQTLEPRLFYLYIPDSTEQNNFPRFDTSEYNVSFYQLFRENRFRGNDRVGDANQVTLALSSRFIDGDTGVEHLRASIGQTFNFQDRNVTLIPLTSTDPHACDEITKKNRNQCPDTDFLSETVGEITARLAEAWSARANLTWDPNEGRVRKGTFGIRYWPNPDTIINAEYRFRKDIVTTDPDATTTGSLLDPTDVDQADISFHIPLNPNWSILGRWNYSFDTEQTLEAVGGVGYESCCWAIQAVARRYVLLNNASTPTTLEHEFDNAIYFQFELKGLGGLGKKTAQFLKRTIPGYEDEF
jgi:LPS-assembly protein